MFFFNFFTLHRPYLGQSVCWLDIQGSISLNQHPTVGSLGLEEGGFFGMWPILLRHYLARTMGNNEAMGPCRHHIILQFVLLILYLRNEFWIMERST